MSLRRKSVQLLYDHVVRRRRCAVRVFSSAQSNVHCRQSITAPPLTAHHKHCSTFTPRHSDQQDNEDLDTIDILDHSDIASLRTICKMPGAGQRVFVVQPNVRRGKEKIRTRDALLKAGESTALIQTLPRWKVIDTRLVNTDHPRSQFIFTRGNLDKLVTEMKQRQDITAVYIGLDVLSSAQKYNLEQLVRVPVYDRYSIVLEIFREHAKTKVAKLQVALAELPYVRARIFDVCESAPRPSAEAHYIGGVGETYITHQRFLINSRESKIRKALEKVKQTREKVRETRKKRGFPTIAVVGYTNSGKTSVIQALTQDASLEPKDQLFATLDVTAHGGTVGAGNMPVLYIDTVGFISDIPTELIASFAATLEDAVNADILLHVCDVSNPSYLEQRKHVHKTLMQLEMVNLFDMVEVFNKVDQIEHKIPVPDGDCHLISALTGQGMEQLKDRIETLAMAKSGRGNVTLRIPIANNAPHLQWLHKHCSIVDTSTCDNTDDYLLVTVVTDDIVLEKFTSRFRDLVVD